MRVKRERDEAVTEAQPTGKRRAKQFSDFWVMRENDLRRHLDRGMTLRQAAEAIGASYEAVKSKARRLGIWPRRTATEPASASEWILAYDGGGLESGPLEVERRLTKCSTRLAQAGEARPHDALTEYIAGDAPGEEEGGGADEDTSVECWFCTICRTMTLLTKAEAGKCCVEPRRPDCPTGLMVPPSEKGEIDSDPIPSKPKRAPTRPKPPKLVLSAPIESVDNGTKAIFHIQMEAPTKKREWDFPPPGGCLFPHGDVGRPGFGFCAEPVAKTGVPYCQTHIQRVYGRGIREEVDDG